MGMHSHEHGVDRKLSIAVLINIFLTVAQVVGGVLSGSLSLVADALHNLSDAGAIVIAVIARKIGNKNANESMTYGYKRAEILGVLINSTTLIVIGLYLIYEAFNKFFNPTPIDGWIVFWVAGIALVIDIGTAFLTYSAGARESMNIRAAFIHNVSDALASVAVIVAGVMIILYQLYIVDVIATIAISVYVIYHGIVLLKKCILILMQAVPEGISINDIKCTLNDIEGVDQVEHVHVWQLDENRLFFEGHLSLRGTDRATIKSAVRSALKQNFGITHCTIEEI
ncbi:cation diffusion facilitator family transporter [Thalassolituus sp. UBA3500]|uniref:cation diffusion facilitator family transporter n=1 Tax=Thalassolituus sp. UBA3500 TaxID=1947664 RepID=UPI000C0DE273|nr:cation diffusion facilitator family transporter [Thalassolituus sp. UBA3500]MBN58338.1 cation transporter [Oceanospirillaceae bacterium]|tara:strand:+ start:7218 stop:8066 length:849 start_codon:yes stop_codon:yes gene_type:complete